MSCFVFAGPSLSRQAIEARLAATILPPATQGDVARAARSGARAIGIIDGYFEGVPSVWHKEVLWAMARGVHVFGAASMGALRAAELHRFGMRGIGAIFEAYRDGALEDDDEVAVSHGPAETGFVALSEAMVNIRATLERALAEGLLGGSEAEALARIAKAQFYKERNWDRLLELAVGEGLAEATLTRLEAWLPEGRIDRKRDDALALVEAMAEALDSGLAPMEVDYGFETTAMWDDALVAGWSTGLAQGEGEQASADRGLDGGLLYEQVLDELRLQGAPFGEARRRAQARLRALREAERAGLVPDDAQVEAELQRFRMEHGLTARSALDRWLSDNDLDIPALQVLIEDEAQLAAVEAGWELAHGEQLLAELRRRGGYAALAARARDKAQVLSEAGYDDADSADSGVQPIQLVRWFLSREAGRGLPEEREELMAILGLSEAEKLYRLIAREYLYCRLTGGSSRGQSGG